MSKLMLLAAGGIGYVLGAKAGRTRYEQIRKGARRIQHDAPVVKEKVAHAAAKVRHSDEPDPLLDEGAWPKDEAAPAYPSTFG